MSVSSVKPEELVKTSEEITSKGEAARAAERMNEAVLSVSKSNDGHKSTKDPKYVIDNLIASTEGSRQDNKALENVKKVQPKLELVKDNFKGVTKGGDARGIDASTPDGPDKGRG